MKSSLYYAIRIPVMFLFFCIDIIVIGMSIQLHRIVYRYRYCRYTRKFYLKYMIFS